MSSETLRAACPHCGRINTARVVAEAPDARPAPGDLSICWGCRRVGIYTVDGVRAATRAEQARIDANPEVRAALAAAAEAYTPSQAVGLLRGAD